MSAPIIWIFLPIIFAAILWFISNRNLVTWLGIAFSFMLVLAAWLLPIDVPLKIGDLSLKISSSFDILGRSLKIMAPDRPLLILFYSSGVLWFLCCLAVNATHKYIPIGMVIIALLIASLAVEPFLYAALIIEIAVLISIPLLNPASQVPGKGILRYLTYQSLAMPFLLFSGWLLSGLTTSPAEISLVRQSTVFLGLGFVFLLAIFPFNTWIPLLAEEAHPLAYVFVLWFFTTIGLLFALHFLDTFAWLRESSELPGILSATGMLMITIGGIWAAFQKELKRIMAYAMIMETGYSIIAISLIGTSGIEIFFGLLIPRAIVFFLWALALTFLQKHHPDVQFSSIKGIARSYPYISLMIVLSYFSLAGLPLLAGYPFHQAIWEQLGIGSITLAFWYFIASSGLIMAGLRSLTVMFLPNGDQGFSSTETRFQKFIFSLGILAIILSGIFHQWMSPFLLQFPAVFLHLGK